MAELKVETLGFKIKPSDKKEIIKAAEKVNLSLSDYAYDRLMKAAKRDLSKK